MDLALDSILLVSAAAATIATAIYARAAVLELRRISLQLRHAEELRRLENSTRGPA